jgi:hypothetical protein
MAVRDMSTLLLVLGFLLLQGSITARTAIAQYDAHSQVFLEDVMSEPAAATAMAREFDKWLTERALAGSPTAQYWMAQRAGMVDHPGRRISRLCGSGEMVSRRRRARIRTGAG